MGARAHYIRRSGGVWQLRYSHWGAETIDRDIFWGPEHTRAFIDAQVAREPDDWMEEVWCEGAVLMDEDRHQLLFYGGMVTFGILTGRVFRPMLRTTWAGWDVRPATLPEIATALGVDPGLVESTYEPEPIAADWHLTPHRYVSTVVTLARKGRIDAFAVDHSPLDLVGLGPDRLLAAGAGTSVTLDEPDGAGLHFDSDRKVAYWWPGDWPPLVDAFAAAWPGWTAEPLGDRFEDHVALARGSFTVRTPPREEIVARVRDHLLAETGTDPADIRSRMEAQHGRAVWATDFDTPVHVRPSPADRARMLDAALAALPRD
jgi:hypothetical protein